MKILEKLGKLREKYENFIANKSLFGFTEFYMKTMYPNKKEKKQI